MCTETTRALLERLADALGASKAVLASREGLLLAGAGGAPEELEELAAYAPSGLPQPSGAPEDLYRRGLEVDGERLYVASVGVPPSSDALEAIVRHLT